MTKFDSMKSLYEGAQVAEAMSLALFRAGDFRGPAQSNTKHSPYIKEEGKKFFLSTKKEFEEKFDEWSSWSNGEEIIMRASEMMRLYDRQRKSGLNEFMPWGQKEYRSKKACLLLEVRRLKNDAKRLYAAAFVAAEELGIDRFTAFAAQTMSGPTQKDFENWAESTAGEQS